jgi:aspartyl-tRNA(Asn)/glutamyl-tRNA(Gln) amidotransferase subunit C
MAKTKVKLNVDEVNHLANLASLPLSSTQTQKLRQTLTETLEYVDKVKSLDTSNVAETHQVTHLVNVFREDIVDDQQLLSQSEALSNVKRSHRGYVVVKAILET